MSEVERWEIIKKRDLARIIEAEKIIKSKQILSGLDYFRLAILFQHGGRKKFIKTAKVLARRAIKAGYEPAKWLLAAATDRLLIMRGRKQKFGTQYKKDKNGKWQLLSVNQTTTDALRAKFNILPLQKATSLAKVIEKRRSLLRSKRIGLTRQK